VSDNEVGAGIDSSIGCVVGAHYPIIAAVGQEKLEVALSPFALGLCISLVDVSSVRVLLRVENRDSSVALKRIPSLNAVSVLKRNTFISCDLVPGTNILGFVEV